MTKKNEKTHMINNRMQQNNNSSKDNKPNDIGGFGFSSSVKIIDPNTNAVILHIRGDL